MEQNSLIDFKIPMNIALLGYGKMGKAIEKIAIEKIAPGEVCGLVGN